MTADKPAADRAKPDRAAAPKTVADKAVMTPTKDQTVPVPSGATYAAETERTAQDAAPTPSEAAMAYAAAESRMSFIYGLVSGPAVFCLGGMVFLLLRRRRPAAEDYADAFPTRRSDQNEVHRAVAAVLAEQARRDGRRPSRLDDAVH